MEPYFSYIFHMPASIFAFSKFILLAILLSWAYFHRYPVIVDSFDYADSFSKTSDEFGAGLTQYIYSVPFLIALIIGLMDMKREIHSLVWTLIRWISFTTITSIHFSILRGSGWNPVFNPVWWMLRPRETQGLIELSRMLNIGLSIFFLISSGITFCSYMGIKFKVRTIQ